MNQWLPSGQSPIICKPVRSTKEADRLYAFVMDWPPGRRVKIYSVGRATRMSDGEISSVRLRGYDGKQEWNRGEDGLVVEFPKEKPCEHVFVLEVS